MCGLSLHCLSALCPPASTNSLAKVAGMSYLSPLPFGSLPPGFSDFQTAWRPETATQSRSRRSIGGTSGPRHRSPGVARFCTTLSILASSLPGRQPWSFRPWLLATWTGRRLGGGVSYQVTHHLLAAHHRARSQRLLRRAGVDFVGDQTVLVLVDLLQQLSQKSVNSSSSRRHSKTLYWTRTP